MSYSQGPPNSNSGRYAGPPQPPLQAYQGGGQNFNNSAYAQDTHNAPGYGPDRGYVSNQPQGVVQMSIQGGGGNRNAKNLPMHDGHRDWSHGLCDCCGDFGTCLLSCICPCIVYAKNKRRLEHLQQQGIPDPEHGGSCCSGDCCLHGALTSFCALGWILQISPRGHIRGRYHIDGGCCGDCCSIFWCGPCALTQESREIQLEEESMGMIKA